MKHQETTYCEKETIFENETYFGMETTFETFEKEEKETPF